MWGERMQVSSANVDRIVEGWVGMSAVWIMFRIGPRMLPCGMPAHMRWIEDIELDWDT
jgi:hypothetical protein